MSRLSSVNPVFAFCQAGNHGFCPGVIVQSALTPSGANVVQTDSCLCGCHDYEEDFDLTPVEAPVGFEAQEDERANALFNEWLAKYHPNIRSVSHYESWTDPLTGEFYD